MLKFITGGDKKLSSLLHWDKEWTSYGISRRARHKNSWGALTVIQGGRVFILGKFSLGSMVILSININLKFL